MRDCTRVYTEGGMVAHYLDGLLSPNEYNAALCGRMPSPGLWLGTGSQDEHERAQDMRLCGPCASIQDERDDGSLTR